MQEDQLLDESGSTTPSTIKTSRTRGRFIT